jgi:hypothetical protein
MNIRGDVDRGLERIIEGVNIIKVNDMLVWKCQNETLNIIQLICDNKNVVNYAINKSYSEITC